MSSPWMSARRRAVAPRRRPSPTPRTGQFRNQPLFESLEDRALLAPLAHPTYIVFHPNGGPNQPYQSPGPVGYTPAQVRKAYGVDSVNIGGIVGDGTGQTIALVDAYDWPTAYADLKAFDAQFGLPDPPSFIKLNQDGQPGPLPSPDAPGGWGGEEALDVEWAHAMAPMANLVLVEANSAAYPDLVQAAVASAAKLPGVTAVSMSFGSGEFAGEASLDPIFTTPAGHVPITFFASTGDAAAPGGYPAYSPNVVAVGGTSLFLKPDNSYSSESGWAFGGVASAPSRRSRPTRASSLTRTGRPRTSP